MICSPGRLLAHTGTPRSRCFLALRRLVRVRAPCSPPQARATVCSMAAPVAAMKKPLAVIVGPGSKHDKDGTALDLPVSSRFGLGGSLALRFSAAGYVSP